MRLLPLLLLFTASCNPCFGQISLSETKVQVVSGLVAPQVVGDAIIIGAESKPVVVSASLIEVKGKEKYADFDIEAENVTNFSLAEMQPVDDTHWLLRGTGKYRVSAIAFGPSLGKDRLIVELTNEPPKPPAPPDPTPGELSQVSKDSRAAMQAFVQSMAGNFDQLASETRLSKFKTVLDASNAANSLDVLSRSQFKAAMAKVMQPKLGSAELPADAAQTFEEIAIGFKGVK